jgi:hypothetical protein
VDVVHGGGERVQLVAGLPALLELALETGDDVVEGEAGLARRAEGADAAHAAKSLRLRKRGATLARVARPARKVESGGARGPGLGTDGATAPVHGAVLLGSRGSGGIGVAEDTDHAGSDLVVDDGLVVLADDIDAELLRRTSEKLGWVRVT